MTEDIDMTFDEALIMMESSQRSRNEEMNCMRIGV